MSKAIDDIETALETARKFLYTGGAAIAAPLPVLLILSLPMAGQREELYSLKGATVPYRYAHPDIQLLLINNYSSSKLLALSTEYGQRYEN